MSVWNSRYWVLPAPPAASRRAQLCVRKKREPEFLPLECVALRRRRLGVSLFPSFCSLPGGLVVSAPLGTLGDEIFPF
jgi:hypothetical protein